MRWLPRFRSKATQTPSKPLADPTLGSTPKLPTICSMCGTQQERGTPSCIKCGVPFLWTWVSRDDA